MEAFNLQGAWGSPLRAGGAGAGAGGGDGEYRPLADQPGRGAAEVLSPDFLDEERYQWEAIQNLDHFFTRIYRYHTEKGFAVIITSRILNLLTLAFTITFSAFLLLKVNYHVLFSDCDALGLGDRRECDLSKAGVFGRRFGDNSGFFNFMVVVYLLLTSVYLAWSLVHFFLDWRQLSDVRDFCNKKMGVSERELQTIKWPDLVTRLVRIQETHRLCIHKDLTAFDIVARITRKENYLIGMLNKGVLALHLPFPGFRRRVQLTKTMEWNIYWCVLEFMFDRNFKVRREFHDVETLQKRFRQCGVINLVLSPFILVFMLMYFVLQNAEKFYHHPGTIGSRNWSPYARWKIREFNELQQELNLRLDNSHEAAVKYVTQFPTHILTHCAKFVAYIAGSFTAALLMVGVANESLLLREFHGQNLVWWIAMFGVILASSRAFIPENPPNFDPEHRMHEVVKWSHFMPRHWRGRCHTGAVQAEFQLLFQYKAILFVEEVFSIFLTPFILYFYLPNSAHRIIQFVQEFTVEIEGVGDVCSLSVFDFQRHGNLKYGSPAQGEKGLRSAQGKMEKSFLSFCALYQDWEPDEHGRALLANLNAYSTDSLGGPAPGDRGLGPGRAGPAGLRSRLPGGAHHSALGQSRLGRPGPALESDDPVQNSMADSQLLLQRYYEDQMHLVLRHGVIMAGTAVEAENSPHETPPAPGEAGGEPAAAEEAAGEEEVLPPYDGPPPLM